LDTERVLRIRCWLHWRIALFLFLREGDFLLTWLDSSTNLIVMKSYYKSSMSGTVVEAVGSSLGVVLHCPGGDYVVGREYEFIPFSERAIWKECSIQGIPYVVHLKDVSNLIQSQKFLDWFNSDTPHTPEETFIFLKEMLVS
jgi:hypothetical protein